jgi:autophagy-related protein 9
VKNEFSKLYDLKLMIILKELVSVLITPFILWISLPKSSDKIIDFFRENTVHIHGLGYVCSYAMFDFSKTGNGVSIKDVISKSIILTKNDRVIGKDIHSTTDAKMLKSYLNFMDSYNDHKGEGPIRHEAYLRAAKKASSQKEGQIDLENSVMAKFNRLHPSGSGKSRLGTVPSDTSINEVETANGSTNVPIIKYSEVQPVDKSYDLAMDSSDQESTSGQLHDGGVLGLLNQFYKQTDASKYP